MKKPLATASSGFSLLQARHTRNPLTPSSITVRMMTSIRSLCATSRMVCFAVLVSMQGTKKLYPGLNFSQLILYVTVSIFIWDECVELQGVGL